MSRIDHPLPSEATSGMEMLSRKFEQLKSDFRAQFGTSFDLLRDTAIYDTSLYKFLERMPKGADLHAHADAILPMDMQVEFLKDHPELVITPEWEIRFIGPGAPYGSHSIDQS